MFDTKWGPVSVGICYDTYNFPELMRYYASKGSRLYLNPTALVERINTAESRRGFLDFYTTAIEYGVICNTIFVAGSNLVGKDRFHYFGGGSCIIGPKITPTTETDAIHYYAGGADKNQAGLFMATLDLSLAKRTLFTNNRYTGVPDYRPDVYKNFVD
jgi:predicted amidohydrolase